MEGKEISTIVQNVTKNQKWRVTFISKKGTYDWYRHGQRITTKEPFDLEAGDRIVVYDDSRLTLYTSDGRVIILGPNTEVEISNLLHQNYGIMDLLWVIKKGFFLVENQAPVVHRMIFIRLGQVEFRIGGGNFFVTPWKGQWSLGAIKGDLKIWIEDREYLIPFHKMWFWLDGRWEVLDIPATLWKMIVSLLEGMKTDLTEGAFEKCMQYVPIMPGATNEPLFYVKPGVSIQNDDPRNYLIRAPRKRVTAYYRSHPPKGKGWILHESSNLLEWKRGESQVVIGISPTGVDGITSIYFHACNLAPDVSGESIEGKGKVWPSNGAISQVGITSSTSLVPNSSLVHSTCFEPIPVNDGWERDRRAEAHVHRSHKGVWDYRIYRTRASVKWTFRKYLDFLKDRGEWIDFIWKERGDGCHWMEWSDRHLSIHTALFCEREDGITEIDLICHTER